MYKRPKLGESEEDLLKLQNDFLKDKENNTFLPAAKVVNAKTDKVRQEENLATEANANNLDDLMANTFEAIPKDMKIGDIKPVDKQNKICLDSIAFANSSSGYPEAKKRDATTTTKSCSIFSQQMKRLRPNSEDNDAMPSTSNVSEGRIPMKSYIVTGKDSNDLHKQNIDLMSRMSEEEILAEREKLMSTLDPAIVSFLKSKRYHNEQAADKNEQVIKNQNVHVNIENIESTADILRDPLSDLWLNFDKIESNKLAWMESVQIKDAIKKQEFEARFDFDGYLLPFTVDHFNEKNRILYHHGQEPERPGYTLQELFQLSRSTILQQKTTALHTIANLLHIYSTGLYTPSQFTLPIEQTFFVLRFAMDDNVPSVALASTRAMCTLLCRDLDEQCLDNMLSFGYQVQPMLSVKGGDEDDGRMNDQELVEVDVVRVAVRSGLVARLRYILNTCESADIIINCLNLLTRFARDSNYALNKIMAEHNLLEILVKELQPTACVDALVKSRVLKFMRVLCSRSKDIATRVLKKHDIFGILIYYITNEHITGNSKGIHLQIECYNLWSIFLHYKMGLEDISAISGSLQSKLIFHIENTNADVFTTYIVQSHVSAIFNFISNLVIAEYDIIFVLPLINVGIKKWITQTSNLIEFKCGKLQIISSVLNLLAILLKKHIIADELIENMHAMLDNIIGSIGFIHLTEEMSTGSNILNNFECTISSVNLLTLEAAVWNNSEHAIPILQTNSSLPFLNALSYCMVHVPNKEVISHFLQHRNIKKYLELLNSSSKFYFTSNWFTKMESNLILYILQISTLVQNEMDTTLFYELTVKSLTIYNNEQRKGVEFLLKNIVFSPSYYPTHVLLENLQLEADNAIFASCLALNEDIFAVYSQVLGLQNVSDYSNMLCESIKLGNILPVDWIYTPILILYSEQQNYKVTLDEEKQVHIIKNCLKWIYIYEKYFPKLADLINPTDRYCRLACVYLGSDDLFLIPEIRNLLRKCLELLIERKLESLDFSGKIEGLSNFEDFFTQLLEQYQGVSYGDELFGIFLLIPLAQKQNIKLRKTLWSEYAGVVQIFNVPEEKIMCPPNIFLDPPETDVSLLRCYRKSLLTRNIRHNAFLHTIAKYHLEMYCANIRANK